MAFFLAVALLPVALAIVAFVFLRRVRRRFTAPGWPTVLTGNGLVLLTLVAAAFLGFESYYRFVYDTTDSWSIGIAHRRWFDRHWHRNNIGQRDDIDYGLKLGGRRRVTFVGDSFTAAHGVEDVQHRFVNIVRRERPHWEVHTLAFRGLETPHQTDAILEFVEEGYEFDTIVLVYCLNDISMAHPLREERLDRVYRGTREQGFLVRHSWAINTLYYRYHARSDPQLMGFYSFVQDHYTGPVWHTQEQILDEFLRAARGSARRVVVVTFPFLHALGDDYAYRPAHEALGRFWKDRGVAHLDLLPVFIDRDPADLVVNRYDAHPNEAAHALAAEAILSFLDER